MGLSKTITSKGMTGKDVRDDFLTSRAHYDPSRAKHVWTSRLHPSRYVASATFRITSPLSDVELESLRLSYYLWDVLFTLSFHQLFPNGFILNTIKFMSSNT